MLLTIAALAMSITQDNTTQYIAHRGANCYAEDNSLEAFEKAEREGFMNEVDIQYTSDGKVVLAHDAEYDSVEVNSKPLRYWKDRGFISLKQAYPESGKVLLDAKDRMGLYEPLERSIDKFFRFRDVYVSTRDDDFAKRMKEEHPRVTMLKMIDYPVTTEDVIDRLKYYDGVNIKYKYLSQDISDVLRDNGYIVVSWTFGPDNPERAYNFEKRADALVVDCVKKTYNLTKKYR
jgi:glycerophosphoryl diester phosphodiesterase